MYLTTAILWSSVLADSTIPKDIEQATGLEKAELDALMAGVEVRLSQSVHVRESYCCYRHVVGVHGVMWCVCVCVPTCVCWFLLYYIAG